MADPLVDPLFTLGGAALEERGRLKSSAYAKFIVQFRSESRNRQEHPQPSLPGLRSGETSESHLRCWEDSKGAGWIAAVQGKSAWFSLSSWGSWRLAFLLAKLQRDLWLKGGVEVRTVKTSTEEAKVSGQRGRPRKEPKEVPEPRPEKCQKTEVTPDLSAKAAKGRGRGRPRKEPKEVPEPRPEKCQKTEVTPDLSATPDPADPPADPETEDPARAPRFPEVPSAEQLHELMNEGRLTSFVRWKKWPFIYSPAWEGQRWSKLLEDVTSGALGNEDLLEEILMKLRRQAAGEKLSNSRLLRKQREAQRKRAAAEAAERPAPQRRPPPQVPGCSCGRPIHTERCRLFRPRCEARAPPHPPRPPPPPGPSAAARSSGEGEPLTAAAKQVLQLERHIEAQPKSRQKLLWKRAMLRCHPDKVKEASSEAQAAEVFIEVKKKYDLFVNLND
ncbi:unnamed protein product [Durusdinium trenchii]|uniref:J domain-containing protein n=1 Tax=Durusdinium trenchii TaxID=1381693 RepID=A0ABP0RHK8_9DINO